MLVAKRLGHSDVAMTLNTYSHLFLEKEDENYKSATQFLKEKIEEYNKSKAL